MSIRLRLTLVFAVLVMGVVAGFSAMLYASQSRQAVGIVEANAVASARRMALFPTLREGGRMHGPPLRPPVAYAQIRGENWGVLERTEALGDVELPIDEAAREAVSGGRVWTDVAAVGGQRLLVASAPVVRDGEVLGVVQVAGSLDLVDAYLGRLRWTLAVMTLGAVAAAVVAGWLVAGAALRPIEAITRTAREIGAERDFTRRVSHAGPDDELGRLARTFDDMLSELQAAYVGVAEALHRQRRFVADASHELRTPLTTIRGNSELLLREPPVSPEDRLAVARDIRDETVRLSQLVQGLLVLARTDAGQSLARERVPVAPLLDELRRQLALVAVGRTVAWPDTAAVVLGDRDALKQVLLNLLDNAVRHTPPEAAVAVEVRPGDAEARTVAILVRDEGPGIPPQQLPRIFERFHRGDPSRTGPGSGLGLSIARGLIEAMGGTLSVASAVGVGSTFTIVLPAPPQREEPAP